MNTGGNHWDNVSTKVVLHIRYAEILYHIFKYLGSCVYSISTETIKLLNVGGHSAGHTVDEIVHLWFEFTNWPFVKLQKSIDIQST